MGDGILDDEGLGAFGMGEDDAKAHGAAVVLHIEGVAGEGEGLGEVVDENGDVVEGVGEVGGVGPVAVAEAGIVGGDEVVGVGEAGEERLKHARG